MLYLLQRGRSSGSYIMGYNNVSGHIIRPIVANIAVCDASKLDEVLLNLNKKSLIGDSLELKVTYNSFKPVYLGIFYYYGFEIRRVKEYKKELMLFLKKEKDIPSNLKPKKYSLLIKLPRTGKNGQRINVYKFRTMQPYSEYLQDYVIKVNGLNSDGTIKNDFRITKFGKFLRKYWLDELPMLINFFKGDLKLIGVRPLGDAMLKRYPKEFRAFRANFKPGLIPPYYIDQPKSFDELIESERRYLKMYQKNPIKTDFLYFFKFLKALFLKGVRSC